MIVIETPFHVSFSSGNERPILACTDKCQKSWWAWDFELRSDKRCPQCGGSLTAALEGLHFKTLKIEKRKLKLIDFISILEIPFKDQQELNRVLKSNIQLTHMSNVKPEFIEKARREWC